jgi:hypothetical protein
VRPSITCCSLEESLCRAGAARPDTFPGPFASAVTDFSSALFDSVGMSPGDDSPCSRAQVRSDLCRTLFSRPPLLAQQRLLCTFGFPGEDFWPRPGSANHRAPVRLCVASVDFRGVNLFLVLRAIKIFTPNFFLPVLDPLLFVFPNLVRMLVGWSLFLTCRIKVQVFLGSCCVFMVIFFTSAWCSIKCLWGSEKSRYFVLMVVVSLVAFVCTELCFRFSNMVLRANSYQ